MNCHPLSTTRPETSSCHRWRSCFAGKRFNRLVLWLPVVTLVIGSNVVAQDNFQENWPSFRGPTFNGTSNTATPPVEWSEEKNVKWKIELPGAGNNSSPVVWGDKVIVLTSVSDPLTDEQKAEMERQRQARRNQRGRGGRRGRRAATPITPTDFLTICYDRSTGKELWRQSAVKMTPRAGTHPDHKYASASPVTDGKHIYSHFGSRGLYCYDMDGNLKWKRDDFGQMSTRANFGEGSSPFLYKDTVIVPWDHEGQSYVMALDALSGETKWKRDRDEPSNWVTPVVVERDGSSIVVTGGQNFARGYGLEKGEELWRAAGFTMRPVASPVVKDDVVYMASGRRGYFLGAMNIKGQGDLNSTDGVAWTYNESAPDIPSLTLSENRIFFTQGSQGILNCVDADSGKAIFKQTRLPGIRTVYASPVVADGKLIIVGRDGSSVVLQDSDKFKVLAQNKLDDAIDATPALAGKQMFLRGKKFLYCIEAD